MNTITNNNMTKIEMLGTSLINALGTNNVERINDKEWSFKDISNGENTANYHLVLSEKIGKSGKTFKNRDLYRVMDDGSEKLVTFGKYKKDYLYKLIKSCTSHKIEKTKCLVNNDVLFAIRDDMKKNKTNYTLDTNTNKLSGNCPNIGFIEINMGKLKSMKNNHKRVFGRELFVDGKLTIQGGGIECIMRAFNAKPRKKK